MIIIDKEEELFDREDYVFIRDGLELYGGILIRKKQKVDFDRDLMIDISSALDKVVKILSKFDDYLDEFKLDNLNL